MRIPSPTRTALLLAALSFPASPVVAQLQVSTAETHGVNTFAPEDFADAAPANAYDMVTRLPGFSIVEADSDVRGYAGARGNVLIDGTQPTSRREDIDDLLKRIPAGSVERIELIRGGAPGVDMGGNAVLANVVRLRAAAVEMALQTGAAIASGGGDGGLIQPQAQFEYGRRRDDRVFGFVLSAESELDDDTGRGRIRRVAADGTSTRDLDVDTRRVDDLYGANASWRQALAGGSLSLNLALRRERSDEVAERSLHARALTVETSADEKSTDALEAGGRYVRPIGARSRLELLLSQRLDRVDALSLSREDGTEERFEEDTDGGESLMRVDFGHAYSDRLSFSAALEGAFNVLESRARLSEDANPVALPGSDVRIEEQRMEASVGAAWRPGDAWSVETDLRVETSSLSQRGDVPTERDFTYVKPRLTAYREYDGGHSVHLALAREVGQLDFDDFVASAALDTGVVSAGNAALEPEKTWRLTAAWERRFGEDGALGLTWTHDRVTDVVDRVLVEHAGDTFDAPGNIGTGRRNTLEMELATSLDAIGLRGFRLSSSVAWRTSTVTDPTTGERRRISGEAPLEGRFKLVQVLPAQRITWGLAVDLSERETKYSYDEVELERQQDLWDVFIERRAGDDWRIRLEARNVFGARTTEQRSKYDGPRSLVPLQEREYRSHRAPRQVLVTVRRSFGS